MQESQLQAGAADGDVDGVVLAVVALLGRNVGDCVVVGTGGGDGLAGDGVESLRRFVEGLATGGVGELLQGLAVEGAGLEVAQLCFLMGFSTGS